LAGAGNHSLVFYNFNGGSNAAPGGVQYPVAAWSNELGLPGTKYRNGTVSFDLFMNNDVVNGVDEKFWTYLDLRLGFDTAYPNTVGDTIVYGNFRIQDGGKYYFFDNATAPSNGHPTLADETMHVKYSILPNETYTLQVNGAYVEKGGSKFIPWRTTGPNAGFNVLGIGSAFGPGGLTNKPFYIDNLVVTANNAPEPTSVALGLIGLLGIALRCRRQK
jgi:MYXO-CTERM domain-containing protein